MMKPFHCNVTCFGRSTWPLTWIKWRLWTSFVKPGTHFGTILAFVLADRHVLHKCLSKKSSKGPLKVPQRLRPHHLQGTIPLSLSLSWWRRPLITSHHSELLFLYSTNDHVVPTDGAKVLMQFFGPVTWHHQRRPLRPRLGLQNQKGPPGVGRRGLLRRSSQSSVYIEKREREREREREISRR
jgi:hypothetical protein